MVRRKGASHRTVGGADVLAGPQHYLAVSQPGFWERWRPAGSLHDDNIRLPARRRRFQEKKERA